MVSRYGIKGRVTILWHAQGALCALVSVTKRETGKLSRVSVKMGYRAGRKLNSVSFLCQLIIYTGENIQLP